jgi:hypothetical protein
MNLNNLAIPGTKFNISNASILGTNDIALQPLLICDPTKGLASHQYINGNCFAAPTTVGQNGPNVIPAVYGPGFFNTNLALFKNMREFRFRSGRASPVCCRVRQSGSARP